MPPTTSPTQDRGGCIDTLPDDALRRVLSFLPAPEAVATCVLARRWRDLWKSAPGLRIMGRDQKALPPADELLPGFVDHLLLSRGNAPLESCELKLGEFGDRTLARLDLWIREVVKCQVRTLRLRVYDEDWEPLLGNQPLVSRNLTRLELAGVELNTTFCDFSGCPSLEHLDIAHCDLGRTRSIASKSLKSLSITNCTVQKGRSTVVNVPSLESLKLAYYYWDGYDKDCHYCYNMECYSGNMLFAVLPGTESSGSASGHKPFSSKRCLKWCDAFRMLKTVLLDQYWCVAPDYQAINCILKNAPVLEKFILQVFSEGPKHKVELIGKCNLVERSVAISQHLKAIKVKFAEFDMEVKEILKYLCTLNICKLASLTPGSL